MEARRDGAGRRYGGDWLAGECRPFLTLFYGASVGDIGLAVTQPV